MNIDRFKKHHLAIRRQISNIREQTRPGIAENAHGIAHSITALRGQVKLHLHLEDEILYPQIEECADPATAQMAKRYRTDMKPLTQKFAEFTNTWTESSIKSDPEGFRASANIVLKALHQRIEHEDREFHPRIEALP